MKFLKNRITLVVLTVMITLGAVSYSFTDNFFEISKNLDIFATLFKELNVYYVDETEPGALMKDGIDAMLNSLDPYTNYIPESDIEDYRFMTTGQYGGVGAIIREHDHQIIIAEPYENSPAAKAGLRAGDIILEIDGKSTKDKTVSDISKVLKGQPATPVKLKIKREGTPESLELSINREEIKIKDVPFYGLADKETGYIKLVSFTESASREVKDALKDLKEKHQIKKVILDLRGNGGGLLRESVNIVNLFVDKGQSVVQTHGKVKEWDKDHKTLSEPFDKEIPLVVLIDNNSASASEIVSGSLQDLDRGVIIGEKSYGKGLVQQTFDLSYNAKLKVTVAKYYIPSGRCIQKLDYAHKDDNGKAIQVADSLMKDFKTKNGRLVKDGAGIKPDYHVEKEELSNISISLLTKSLIFDFATQYRLKNENIGPADAFTLKEQDFNDFIKFIADKEYDYETKSEKVIAEVEKAMTKEKIEEALQARVKQLKEDIKKSKKNDIYQHKEEIKELIEEEIVSRYYYQRGRVEKSLKYDDDIKKALEILNAPQEYSATFKSDFKTVEPKN